MVPPTPQLNSRLGFVNPGLTYYYTYVYIYICVNYNDLTVLPNPGIMVDSGNHPQMAEQFRLVKY